jgi:hypothetical protein
MRVPKNNMLILWIVIEPKDFTRDRMSMLAHQLNRDFPNESLINAVFFDSEETVRHYNPAGASYSISKELERGEYNLDRVKGRESINFSLQRGSPVNEIKIVLSNKVIPVRKRKRVSRWRPLP